MADHDIHHLSATLAAMLDDAVAVLAAQGERHGVELTEPDADPDGTGGPLAPLRERTGTALAGRPVAGALLLADLRRYLSATADASIACIILAQGAQASADPELLDAVTAAHDTVLRTHRWALTRLKVTAPQVLTS